MRNKIPMALGAGLYPSFKNEKAYRKIKHYKYKNSKLEQYIKEATEIVRVNELDLNSPYIEFNVDLCIVNDELMKKAEKACKRYNKTGVIHYDSNSLENIMYYENYLRSTGENIDMEKVLLDCAREQIKREVIKGNNYSNINVSKLYVDWNLDEALANNNIKLSENTVKQILDGEKVRRNMAEAIMYNKRSLMREQGEAGSELLSNMMKLIDRARALGLSKKDFLDIINRAEKKGEL